MLAALVVWRRLLREGPAALGRTTYWGTAPLWSTVGTDIEASASPGTPGGVPLVDVLDTAVSSVEARFQIGADGVVLAMEMWPAPDDDPCEIRFADDGGNGPGRLEVRHGDELFGVFRVESFDAGSAGRSAADPLGSGIR